MEVKEFISSKDKALTLLRTFDISSWNSYISSSTVDVIFLLNMSKLQHVKDDLDEFSDPPVNSLSYYYYTLTETLKTLLKKKVFQQSSEITEIGFTCSNEHDKPTRLNQSHNNYGGWLCYTIIEMTINNKSLFIINLQNNIIIGGHGGLSIGRQIMNVIYDRNQVLLKESCKNNNGPYYKNKYKLIPSAIEKNKLLKREILSLYLEKSLPTVIVKIILAYR